MRSSHAEGGMSLGPLGGVAVRMRQEAGVMGPGLGPPSPGPFLPLLISGLGEELWPFAGEMADDKGEGWGNQC